LEGKKWAKKKKRESKPSKKGTHLIMIGEHAREKGQKNTMREVGTCERVKGEKETRNTLTGGDKRRVVGERHAKKGGGR